MADLPAHRGEFGVGVMHSRQRATTGLHIVGGDDESRVVIPDEFDAGTTVLTADHREPRGRCLDDHLPPRFHATGEHEHPRLAEHPAEVGGLEKPPVVDAFDSAEERFERTGAARRQRPRVRDALAVGPV